LRVAAVAWLMIHGTTELFSSRSRRRRWFFPICKALPSTRSQRQDRGRPPKRPHRLQRPWLESSSIASWLAFAGLLEGNLPACVSCDSTLYFHRRGSLLALAVLFLRTPGVPDRG